MRRPRVCLVTAVPITINAFLQGHIRALSADYDVTVVSNCTAADVATVLGPRVAFAPAPIVRPIAPWRDLVALLALWRLFRKDRFDAVHSVTPKAGLLSMLAARAAGVPCRFHTFTGQIWATRRGPMRWLLRSLDRLMAKSATHVLTDSISQRTFLAQQGIVGQSDVTVLAEGSVAGVNTERFAPDAGARDRIRADFRIASGDVVFMYLGRLNRDKGVPDLLHAFDAVAANHPAIQLLLAGPDEEGLEPAVSALAARWPGRVHRVPYTQTPERFMAAADVICLPSYREGFGVVLIEGAAVGLPALASRIYGITDAVLEGVTGLLHPPGDRAALATAMRTLTDDAGLRRRLGAAARDRVRQCFTEAHVTGAMTAFYRAHVDGAAR